MSSFYSEIPEEDQYMFKSAKVHWFTKLRMLPLRFTLAPIRLIVFLIAAVGAWIIARIFSLCAPSLRKPLPMRHWYYRLSHFVIMVTIRFWLWCFGYWWITHRYMPGGERTLGKKAQVVIANHCSYVDGILMLYTSGAVIVAKEGMFKIPILGFLVRATGTIAVERGAKKAHSAAEMIVERANTPIGEYPPVAMFPEGTTTNQKALIHFHTGAFLAGVPVQPVLLMYPYKYYDQAWASAPTLGHLWGLWSQWYNRVEVVHLPIYEPNEEERKDPRLYANNVSKVMAAAMDVPRTNHSIWRNQVIYVDMDTGVPLNPKFRKAPLSPRHESEIGNPATADTPLLTKV